MESKCSVCGCITDSTELQSVKLLDEDFPVCPFCVKKIRAIEKYPMENAKMARELLSADTKGKRSARCSAMMYRYFYSLGISPVEPASAESGGSELQKEVASLRETVDTLQKDLKKFKRSYYVSKILGIVLPVVITFIMLIILLKSGALNSIFEYYGMLSDYASL